MEEVIDDRELTRISEVLDELAEVEPPLAQIVDLKFFCGFSFGVLGIPCLGLKGGPVFRHTEAFSFQIATENQEETDRYWSAIVGNGGTESQCGWCKDRWGLSWQITPRALTDALAAGGCEARRAFVNFGWIPKRTRSPFLISLPDLYFRVSGCMTSIGSRIPY